ncbi:TKL protein kinase [Phytophthora nicotianae P10297]|uniref:TKL protein kinase n=1 Tax=Phytophthora nicotianae P10297 TaxID=1317064 RepID=W2ZUE8_PHYNI|nr:TKL protein kinase [Phytophthora nicotianae P10297]
MNSEINSATVGPSSNFTTVSTRKETTSSGEEITTVTTTTVSTMKSSASSSTTSTNTATEGSAGHVSETTMTTTEGDNGASPVTTVGTKSGVNTTRTSTTRDAVTGITTVTTTTDTDSDMNGSASRSTTEVTTSGSSTAEATSERSATSTITSTSSTTGASTSNSVSSTTNSKIATGSANSANAILTSGSTNYNSATASSSTSTSTTTNSLTGSTYGDATANGSKGSATSEESATSSQASSLTSSEASTYSAMNSLSGSDSLTDTSSNSSFLTSWFTKTFRDEETQLVVGAITSTTTTDISQVCDGLPALVTRSSTETPNGGCPDELTALNASCTCITGYSETASTWSFHVTAESWNSTTTTTTRSLTQISSDELAVNTIRSIWVSSSLETLEIEGAGETPAEITFINEDREDSGSSLTLVRSESNSTNISTLSIYNVDLNSVAETNSHFVPASVTTLTLRNCNISTLSHAFTREWSWLQYLDLSSNNIDTEYIGGAYLKELNLSHNALAVFPTGSLNTSGLEALYIQGNNIKNFNVSQDQFEQIQGLTAFSADKPDSSSTCEDGAWQSAHGTTFCVLGASTAAVPDSSRSSSSSSDDDNGLGLLGYWLIAGAIIVFFLLLLVIWQRRRQNEERESSPIVSPDAVEANTPKVNANAAFGDALNHDNTDVVVPPAATGAAGAAAYPGYGRSHGNSVDSEDTALGASLTNNQVLASCRLDYDEVTLGRCISRGGFGLVFVGSYKGRQVAVKKIRNERGVEREQVEQFVGEISLISGLNHPRIVEFIGACWTTPAELSAVTEMMERGDLRDVTRRFKRRGYRLTWETHKTVIALHIAEALTYLHGQNPTVIHRDLKAKNVLLNADMEAKLSDFGIARKRTLYDGSEHMTVGIGTSFWIAPEVLLGRDYDERADIYSFGVVLSEIDTDDYPYWNAQHPPQGKAQENEILRLVARGAKRPAFSDDCPPAILELAARCLRADPEERPSASEIVVYLQQLVVDRTSSASFSSIMRPVQSLDFVTNFSTSTSTAPANTIVNLSSSEQSQAMSVASSTAATNASGKSTKTTTTTTTTKVIPPGQALTASHEVVTSSPHVTQKVVRANIPKGTRTTTTTTTTWRAKRSTGSSSSIGMAVGSSDGGSSGPTFGTLSSRTHSGLGPTSPSSLRDNLAELDHLNQQRQLSSSSAQEATRSSAQAVGNDHREDKWVVYEDVKEL